MRFHGSRGVRVNIFPFVCPHFKEGGELGAGVYKASKNKHTDLESSARSHGCMNIKAP